MHLTYRQTCRICGSRALTPVIDLGEQHLQGAFLKPDKENPPLRKIPTTLVRCDPMKDETACGLLQMATTIPPELLYSSYWYRSGTNETMRQHLRGIASAAAAFTGRGNARVLDIGCNDGTLLGCYPASFARFGVDPSDIATEVDESITVIRDIFPSPELSSLIGEQKFDIITSIAMFYDLEDPFAFVKEIGRTLSDDGVWIFEMSYMPDMLALNSYDTICHEHLEYYSFAVLEKLVQRCGMKIARVEFNKINGGSIRGYATHIFNFKFKTPENLRSLTRVRQQEFDLALDTDQPYRNFQDRINQHKIELCSLLRKLKSDGKTIHVYGASTKGNTILQWCGIDRTLIDCAADRNPDKDGARTIGSDIPIVSEAKSRAMKPDYYLVLPWHFKEEFLQREKTQLDKGVGFIFPLPAIEVIKR